MMYYYIYKITNLINGKIYIGKHQTTDIDDDYFGSGKYLHRAFKKYGLENFRKDILLFLNNAEELALEERLVVNRDFVRRPDTYNLSIGGQNPILYGENNGFFNKTHSNNTKKRWSKQRKGRKLTNDWKANIGKGLKKLHSDSPFTRYDGARITVTNGIFDLRIHPLATIPSGYYRKTNKKYEEKDILTAYEVNYMLANGKSYKQAVSSLFFKSETFIANDSKRKSKSHWWNNGTVQTFAVECPEGFVKGRLPGLNVGRKLSEESRMKISRNNKGHTPWNKGKRKCQV